MYAALIFSSLSLVAAQQQVGVTVESSESKFNNKGISNIHFGAAINGVLVSDQKIQYSYNTTDKSVYTTIQTGNGIIPMSISVEGGDLVFAPFENHATVENNYLTLNGSSSVFYACKTLPFDPYRYTANNSTYGIAVYPNGAPPGCSAVKLRVDTVPGSSVGNSSSASTSTSGHAGGNATATVLTTKYTTIDCPTPTTVTYGSSTFTVTASTLITVEDCGCTQTPTMAAPSPSNSTAPTSSIPVVNGASHIQVGGLVGLAAAVLLI